MCDHRPETGCLKFFRIVYVYFCESGVSMNHSKDQEIIHALQQGDEGPFKAFYSREYEKLISWCKKNWSMSHLEAKDLYQDSQMYLYENIVSGSLTQLNSELSTYLYAIAKNQVRNKLRKQVTISSNEERLTEHLEFLQGLEDLSEEKRVLVQKIVKALENMKEPCKSILHLFYYAGLSMQTIADRLGYKNDSVVKNQKKRCIVQLRSLYEKQIDPAYE